MAAAPRIPNPPAVYDAPYFDQIFRLITSFFVLSNTGLANGSSVDYSTLPTTGYNLRNGQIYNDAGFVKIVLDGVVYVTSFSLTSSLGTIVAS